MHYLEDLIDLLEYLPAEVEKKCIEIKNLDKDYQDQISQLRMDSRDFFSVMKTLPTSECQRRHKELQERYQRLQDYTEEKVKTAEYLQSVLEKYQERVVKDLLDLKAELEADNPSEVELIEKDFTQSATNPYKHDMDGELFVSTSNGGNLLKNADLITIEGPSTSEQHILEGEIFGLQNQINGHSDEMANTPRSRSNTKQYEDFKIPHLRRPSQPPLETASNRASFLKNFDDDIFDAEFSPPIKRPKPAPPQRQLSFNILSQATKNSRETSPRSTFSSISSRSASPAIGQHMSKFSYHPQRYNLLDTASTSNQADNVQIPPDSVLFRQQQHDDTTTFRQSTLMKMPSFAAQASRHGRPRKLTKKVEQMLIGNRLTTQHVPPSTSTMMRKRRKRIAEEVQNGQLEEIEDECDEDEEFEDDEGGEEEQDDRVWCYCKQGSAGDMVACDNKNCPYEWFHYECVGIEQPPKGRWYCPTCSMRMNTSSRC